LSVARRSSCRRPTASQPASQPASAIAASRGEPSHSLSCPVPALVSSACVLLCSAPSSAASPCPFLLPCFALPYLASPRLAAIYPSSCCGWRLLPRELSWGSGRFFHLLQTSTSTLTNLGIISPLSPLSSRFFPSPASCVCFYLSVGSLIHGSTCKRLLVLPSALLYSLQNSFFLTSSLNLHRPWSIN
jgi:hypothetical protein